MVEKMGRKYKQRVDDEAKVDMTPMLDIVFIMLIFFIVTTSFVKEAGIEVKTLEKNTKTTASSKSVTISIESNGMILMNGRYVDLERVVANIQSFLAENNTTNALVRAQAETPHGLVVEVIDKTKQAGIENVMVTEY